MKHSTYHLYAIDTEDDYGPTACGRDGEKVGGLITGFFKLIKSKYRCKTCNKIFKKRNKKHG